VAAGRAWAPLAGAGRAEEDLRAWAGGVAGFGLAGCFAAFFAAPRERAGGVAAGGAGGGVVLPLLVESPVDWPGGIGGSTRPLEPELPELLEEPSPLLVP